jgi:hypothetical protein
MAIKDYLPPDQMKEAVDGLNAKLDAVIDKVGQVEGKVVTIPAAKPTRPDGALYDVVGGKPPEPEAEEKPKRGRAPRQVSAEPQPRALSDAEIYDRVANFLDPLSLGPIFISKPIRGRVYIGKYPNFSEMLAAGNIVDSKDIKNANVAQVYQAVGELRVTIKGWLPAADPRLDKVIDNITDASKWPPLNEFEILNQRDPRTFDDVFNLWTEYLAWKALVTPTDDQLEKF